MIAIEFEADVHDGIIKIPDRYKDKIGKHIKVIALMDEPSEKENVSCYTDEYIEKNWRQLIVTSNMGGDFEKSQAFEDQRNSFLMDKYR